MINRCSPKIYFIFFGPPLDNFIPCFSFPFQFCLSVDFNTLDFSSMRWSIYVSISLVMTGVALCCCSIYPVVRPVLLIQILLRYDSMSSPCIRVAYYCPSREFRAFFLSSFPHVGCRLLIHSHVGNLPIWCISLVRLIIFGPMFSLRHYRPYVLSLSWRTLPVRWYQSHEGVLSLSSVAMFRSMCIVGVLQG